MPIYSRLEVPRPKRHCQVINWDIDNKSEMERNRINILELRDSPWVDGPGRTILESAARINPERYGNYIGAFCRRNSTENPFLKAGFQKKLKIFRIDESCSYDPTILFQIRCLIKKEKINIIHTHEVRSDIVGLISGKMCRNPLVATLHGWIQNGFKGKFFTKFDKSILRFFDHVIAVSERMKEEVLRFGVNKEKVSVLHNALVIDNFRRNLEDRSFRREIGVSDEILLVGNIGRLSPEKGQADFVLAASAVLQKHKDVRFILVGKGDDESRLRKLVQDLGVRNEIIFAGYRENMVHVYNSLDLVVQSSYTEGMPNVILEALAMKVPVIATDVGGTSEAIMNNETGVLVQPGEPEELAIKMLDFVKSKDAFKKMVERGRKVVEAKFNIEERTRRLSEIYDRVIFERRKTT